ncbi:MAG: hypothetical protein LBI06_07705 [Treponema sp.]|nr:hypothetical protein [Treponema sp.]
MRIRLVRDTLRLNPPPELFLERSMDDLTFVNGVLEILVRTFLENSNRHGGNGEADYISDTEWQFTQLLTEFSLESSPFSAASFPETTQKIAALREASNSRRKTIEGFGFPTETAQAEPVVSSAELSGLLGTP